MKQHIARIRRIAGRFAVGCLAAAPAIGLAPLASAAHAATFTVDPTQIYLSARSTSVLLRLRNESTETLRFQLSVFAWSQSGSGEMQLEATQDIVFFPSLLELKPGEERRVRVGSATPFAAREKTYRIFVEELPPLDANASSGGTIRVLTKMGIPIFLRPSKEVASAALKDLSQSAGHLRFTLANTGTVHFVPQRLTVRGVGASGIVFEQPVEGWYLLAGGSRVFDVTLPQASCERIRSLAVEAQFSSATLEERVDAPSGICSP